jgi:hypothetical protein
MSAFIVPELRQPPLIFVMDRGAAALNFSGFRGKQF